MGAQPLSPLRFEYQATQTVYIIYYIYSTYKTTLLCVISKLGGRDRARRATPGGRDEPDLGLGVQISMAHLQNSMPKAPHEQRNAIFARQMMNFCVGQSRLSDQT